MYKYISNTIILISCQIVLYIYIYIYIYIYTYIQNMYTGRASLQTENSEYAVLIYIICIILYHVIFHYIIVLTL